MASVTVVRNQTFISVNLAGRYLGCSREIVWKLLESGELKGFRLSPRGWWMVNKQSVERKVKEIEEFGLETKEERISVNQDERRDSYAQRHRCI